MGGGAKPAKVHEPGEVYSTHSRQVGRYVDLCVHATGAALNLARVTGREPEAQSEHEEAGHLSLSGDRLRCCVSPQALLIEALLIE